MKSAQKLKSELEFNQELLSLLDVLKGIAAWEFWNLEKKKLRFKTFLEAFKDFFKMIDFSKVAHPFAKEEGKLALIIVTSDEGFMRGLNTQVINKALDLAAAEDVHLCVIGEKGAGYLRGLQKEFTMFKGIKSQECYQTAVKLKDYIMEQGKKTNLARWIIVYPQSLSFMSHSIKTIKLLPCHEIFEEEYIGGDFKKEMIVESDLHQIIEFLVEVWITQKLFEIFEDSKLAEFSARTMHLEESHQFLERQGTDLRHKYFKSYHELVDCRMREIFSAQVAKRRKEKVG